jgi:hypothetical protein
VAGEIASDKSADDPAVTRAASLQILELQERRDPEKFMSRTRKEICQKKCV